MAERTGIAWTRSTFNPWIGCTEVSPGCDGCYARVLDSRHRYGGSTHWGAGVPRFVTSLDYWLRPEKWNAIAAKERSSGKIEDGSDWHTPGFYPVFPSMCDPFDKEVEGDLRYTFWQLILDNPYITWLLLTKRIGNAIKMLPPAWLNNPPPNVWLGASVVNQEEADRDIPKLLDTPAAKRFVSYEPALGPISWKVSWLSVPIGDGPERMDGIDQIIVGGESNQGKHRAREFRLEWARTTREACRAAGIAFFMKQAGAMPQEVSFPSAVSDSERKRWHNEGWTSIHDASGEHWRRYYRLKDRAGADPVEWPEDLRVQEFPA